MDWDSDFLYLFMSVYTEHEEQDFNRYGEDSIYERGDHYEFAQQLFDAAFNPYSPAYDDRVYQTEDGRMTTVSKEMFFEWLDMDWEEFDWDDWREWYSET